MSKVLITSEFFGKFSGEAKALLLAAGLTVTDNPYGHAFLSPEQIIRHIGDADAIICDLEKITKEVIDAAPKLKIIARRGVGIDSVDWRYAETKGIETARTLGVVENPVAELVMGYILDFARNISVMSAAMHAGEWRRVPCHSVDGATLGLVGFGNIAQTVARRAAAMGMNIAYYDIVRNEQAERALNAVWLPLEELLSTADYVSLHTPLTDDTRHMLDARRLALMKPSACLINTARGAVVDTDALAAVLRAGRLHGAAVDVYDVEPDTNSPLRGIPGVILTPHVGTFTEEVFIRMDVAAAKHVIRKLTT